VKALLHTLLIALGASALISGVLLMVHPDGAALRAPLVLLERTPFRDFFWPGLILASVFGLGGVLASVAIARQLRIGLRFAQVIGAGQVVWILFQVYWFPILSPLQPILAGVGLAIILLAEGCRRMDGAR